jgi:PTS system nitrogen regulatory IIA component
MIRYSTALPSYYFGSEPGAQGTPRSGGDRTPFVTLTPADVLVALDVRTKDRALQEIARFIASRHGLSESDVHASLVERERVGSTALGFGIAIPHARLKGLLHPVAAFLRTKDPIPFNAPDDRLVSDLFVLLLPEDVADEHLQLLAAIAEMFSDRRFRDDLRRRVDAMGVHAMLESGLVQRAAVQGGGSA